MRASRPSNDELCIVFQRRHGGSKRCDRARLSQCPGAYKRQPLRQLRQEHTERRRPGTGQTVRRRPVLADQQREAQGVLWHVRHRHRRPDHEGSGHTGRFTRWKLSVGLSIRVVGPTGEQLRTSLPAAMLRVPLKIGERILASGPATRPNSRPLPPR